MSRSSQHRTRKRYGIFMIVPDYAVNLSNCPTVAYSGERDRQKQAADVMAAALLREGDRAGWCDRREGRAPVHARGQGQIDRRMDRIIAAGRMPVPP